MTRNGDRSDRLSRSSVGIFGRVQYCDGQADCKPYGGRA
jgi:hypothetical protein